MVFFAHCHCELIHDTAVASVEVILRILSDQCQIDHADSFESKQITYCKSCQYFQRCGRRKSGTVRDRAVDQDIHTGRDLVSSAFHCPHNSLRIVGPSCFFRIYQIIQACLDHAQFAEVFRIETDRTVFTFADDHVSSDAQCTWENVSSVVVCMLSDQVYTSR